LELVGTKKVSSSARLGKNSGVRSTVKVGETCTIGSTVGPGGIGAAGLKVGLAASLVQQEDPAETVALVQGQPALGRSLQALSRWFESRAWATLGISDFV
jgi:hypothetical protein